MRIGSNHKSLSKTLKNPASPPPRVLLFFFSMYIWIFDKGAGEPMVPDAVLVQPEASHAAQSPRLDLHGRLEGDVPVRAGAAEER